MDQDSSRIKKDIPQGVTLKTQGERLSKQRGQETALAAALKKAGLVK